MYLYLSSDAINRVVSQLCDLFVHKARGIHRKEMFIQLCIITFGYPWAFRVVSYIMCTMLDIWVHEHVQTIYKHFQTPHLIIFPFRLSASTACVRVCKVKVRGKLKPVVNSSLSLSCAATLLACLRRGKTSGVCVGVDLDVVAVVGVTCRRESIFSGV